MKMFILVMALLATPDSEIAISTGQSMNPQNNTLGECEKQKAMIEPRVKAMYPTKFKLSCVELDVSKILPQAKL